MNAVNIGSATFDLAVYGIRQKKFKAGLLFGLPEGQCRLHQPDDLIAALHMALLPQKMNQHILPKADLIQAGRDISQDSFSADITEKGWQKTPQLLDEVVHRTDIAVQKLGDIAGKQIRILDKDAAQQ